MTLSTVSAGFIPLVDAAPLIIAREKGFDTAQGLSLQLRRSSSWAALRDRLSVGDVDAAHMLAPVVVASQLGVGNPKAHMVAPCALSMNGNAISVSLALHAAMREAGFVSARDPARAAQCLARVIGERRARGQEALTFASVYPLSSHSYELRYWLASAGIDPDVDVNLTIVPPPMIVDALAEGHIDGFCVGAPWSGLGADSGLSCIVAYKADIWPQGPEKVLALREDWAEAHGELVSALVRMHIDSAAWCADPEHHAELAHILGGADYLGVEARIIARALAGTMIGEDGPAVRNHLLFDPRIASYPWRSHALWFYGQMVRWGQVEHSESHALAAKKAYRPDLYRKALATGAADPAQPLVRGEGPPIPALVDSAAAEARLFDGRLFDPDDLDGYFGGLGLGPAP